MPRDARKRNMRPAEVLRFYKETKTPSTNRYQPNIQRTALFTVVAQVQYITRLRQFAEQFGDGVADLGAPRWVCKFRRPKSDIDTNSLLEWRGKDYKVIAIQMTENDEFVHVTIRLEGEDAST